LKKICILLCICGLFSLSAEEIKVLHRVHVAAPRIENPDEVPPLFTDPGTTLFALINNTQALIDAPEEEANSTIRTVVRPADGGTEIIFTLERRDADPVVSSALISEEDRHGSYKEFLNRSAEIFSPYLERVSPEIKIRELAADEETRDVLDELLFIQSMQTPFEASLWMGIATKSTNGSDGGPLLYLHFPFQYFGEFSWYRAPNHGISITLFVEYSDYLRPVEADTRELYVLPGIGYTYRTLGRFSAGFFTGLNVGAMRMHAEEDVLGEDWISLSAGESKWFLFQYFVMKPFVSYAFNKSWSIKTSLTLYMDLLELFQIQPAVDFIYQGEMAAEIQFFNIGFSYRWK